MSDVYIPPDVWQWDQNNGGKFASTNRPIAGATYAKSLPSGEHPFQLHSMATPNGVKVTIMFEELLELGITEAEYDAWYIDIMEGDQFSSGFVEINPNSKIPAMTHRTEAGERRVFESGAILMYLAEHFQQFLPIDKDARAETMSWLFWQVGSGPFLGGGFGHFYAYAPEKYEYPINRFAMEVKRQLDVLDKRLESNTYLAGEEYTIADMAIYPWYGLLIEGKLYEAAMFLDVDSYTHVKRWAEMLAQRPAVIRGRRVNRAWGEETEQLRERHSAKDFE